MAKSLLFITLILLSTSMIYSQSFLSVKMDVFQCISDVTNIKTEVQNFLAQNVTVEALIAEFTTLEPMIQNALTDCGVTNVSLSKVLFPGTEQVPVSFDFLQCLSDLNQLATIVGEVSTDISTGNIINVVQDLVSLRTVFTALLSDCVSNSSLNVMKGRVLSQSPEAAVGGVFTCYSDITDKLIPDLENFVNVSKSGQISDIILQLNVLVADIKVVLADCELGSFVDLTHVLQHLNTLSPIDCLSDVSNLVNLAETIIQNFNSSNYEELISNLVQFVNTVQQAVSDCTSFNTTLTKARDMILNNEATIECAGEFNQLAINISAFTSAAKTSSKYEIAYQLRSVFQSFKGMLDTCGVRNCPVLNRIVRIDPFSCFNDIELLVSLAEQTLNDTESYDIVSVISDVEHLVSIAELAYEDCLGENITTIKRDTADVLQCVSDVEFEINQLNEVLNSLRVGNYSDVIARVSSIVESFNALLEDCGLNSTIQSIGQRIKINPEGCLNDVVAVYNIINQVIQDVQNQSWSQLLNDGVVALEQVAQLSGDCFDYNLTNLINPVCIQDAEYTIQNLVSLYEKIVSSNSSIFDIIQDVSNIAQQIQWLENDCGLNVTTLFKNGNLLATFFPNLQGSDCGSSVQKLSDAFVAIISGGDFMEKINKISEIKKLVAEVQANCFGSETIKTPKAIVSYITAKGLRM